MDTGIFKSRQTHHGVEPILGAGGVKTAPRTTLPGLAVARTGYRLGANQA